jgi:hypothetical protein
MSYRVLALPERETMTPTLLRKVRDLVTAGATVIGPRPRKSPSLAGYPECDAEVERLAAEIWGDCDGLKVQEHAFGLGRVVWVRAGERPGPADSDASPPAGAPPAGPTDPAASGRATWSVGAPPLDKPEQYGDFAVVTAELEKMSVLPDFSSDVPLRWIHRRDGATEIYFVANPEPRTVDATAVFRVSGLSPELWDPIEGTNRSLAHYTASEGRTAVPLRFEPHQSFFIVFRDAVSPASSAGPAPASETNVPIPAEIASLEGPWDVAFDPKWGGPEKITFEALDDWSRRPESGIKYYSGTAVYTKTFDLPRAVADSAKSDRVWLDLGTVKNVAGVRLNGHDLGVVWCDPWRVEITKTVKPAGNRLEIRVANLWPNRLIGDEKEPPDAEYARGGNLSRWPEWLVKGEPRPSARRLTFSTWKHYGKDSPLLPSGLLGPVRVLRSFPIP